MDVIFDTASDWLTLNSASCTSCKGNLFDASQSTTATQVGTIESQRVYGAIQMNGYEYTDQICLSEDVCIEDFEFFLVENQQENLGLSEPVNGILGLARNMPFYLELSNELDKQVQRGPSFLHALKNSKQIQEATFSFTTQPYGASSRIDFGPINNSSIKQGSQIEWIDVNEDFFWSVDCSGFAIGSTVNSWQWSSIEGAEETISRGAAYSIFDTGSSAIMLPEEYFSSFLDLIYTDMADNEHEEANGYVISQCYDDFPELHFLLSDKWVTVKPEDYVVDVSEAKDRSLCVLLLSPSSQPFLVLGMPLYMNYYVVHDDQSNRIGFAPHIDSPKDDLKTGS